ncbi:MAG: hypothetical protein K2G62_06585 [Oscillospiraceae bacterium]|nr:hypothetical protein [Oscillospiraceae bacterium]
MTNNPEIQGVAAKLIEKCSDIEKIYLISNKISTNGTLTSFKLSLIVKDEVESISELECRLYMEVDSDMPYDIVLYTRKEFDELKDDEGTFAWKIYNSGAVLYG